MSISVIGLGYVGCVSAACLAARGHDVVGVDVSPVKVDLINGGNAPVVEERIGELTAEVVASGKLRATTDIADAIANTDVSLGLSIGVTNSQPGNASPGGGRSRPGMPESRTSSASRSHSCRDR